MEVTAIIAVVLSFLPSIYIIHALKILLPKNHEAVNVEDRIEFFKKNNQVLMSDKSFEYRRTIIIFGIFMTNHAR